MGLDINQFFLNKIVKNFFINLTSLIETKNDVNKLNSFRILKTIVTNFYKDIQKTLTLTLNQVFCMVILH